MEKRHALTEHKTLVARERFELSSEAPEAPMLDHYTTGLRVGRLPRFLVITLTLLRFTLTLVEGFSDAIAFLADSVIVFTEPQRAHYRVFVLGIAR